MKIHILKRFSGGLKDRRSLCFIILKNGVKKTDMERAIVKATNHDEIGLDYRSTKRIMNWVKGCSSHLKIFFAVLANRMMKTKNWVVALKGLILVHEVFCSKIPHLRNVGQLPFDFSEFHDRSNWGCSTFIKSYFVFLDRKSGYLIFDGEEDKIKARDLAKTLLKLQRCQILLDLLLKIKPFPDSLQGNLIPDAMDYIILEIFSVYNEIQEGISSVFSRISGAGKVEVAMALGILQKSVCQMDALDFYLQLCSHLGLINKNSFPPIHRVSEKDINDLEKLLLGIPNPQNLSFKTKTDIEPVINGGLKTVITDKWVHFNDDLIQHNTEKINHTVDPFAASLNVPPHFS